MMDKGSSDAHKYSFISVVVFGILGNLLVVISIARQKHLLKTHYYYLVLHLAVCDLGALMLELPKRIEDFREETPNYTQSTAFCTVYTLYYSLFVSGMGMMLLICVLRYRAIVHPLKPAISRRNLTVVCLLAYVIGLIVGVGFYMPPCYVINHISMKAGPTVALLLFIFPVIFIAICYFKIGRTLVEQNKQMKRFSPIAVRGRHNRERRIFFVCVSTVVCYAVGRLLFSVSFVWYVTGQYELLMKNMWLYNFSRVVNDACTHAVNPLIYGILDKRIFAFLKFRRRRRAVSETLETSLQQCRSISLDVDGVQTTKAY